MNLKLFITSSAALVLTAAVAFLTTPSLHRAFAAVGGSPGPMNGAFVLTIKNKEYEPGVAKPASTTAVLNATVTDFAGDSSLIDIVATDQESNVLHFTGQRVGTAFTATNLGFVTDELITISGTISKPDKNGVSKTFRGSGSSATFQVTAVPTSDGGFGPPAGVALFTFTAKRPKILN